MKIKLPIYINNSEYKVLELSEEDIKQFDTIGLQGDDFERDRCSIKLHDKRLIKVHLSIDEVKLRLKNIFDFTFVN